MKNFWSVLSALVFISAGVSVVLLEIQGHEPIDLESFGVSVLVLVGVPLLIVWLAFVSGRFNEQTKLEEGR